METVTTASGFYCFRICKLFPLNVELLSAEYGKYLYRILQHFPQNMQILSTKHGSIFCRIWKFSQPIPEIISANFVHNAQKESPDLGRIAEFAKNVQSL